MEKWEHNFNKEFVITEEPFDRQKVRFGITPEEIIEFIRQSRIDAVIGELDGLEVGDLNEDNSNNSTATWNETYEEKMSWNRANAEWRLLRDSRISALRKKL